MAKLNINSLLKQYGLSQKDLSECTGINKNTISKYCNDTFENINKTHIDLLCKFFDCTLIDLFEVDDNVEVNNPSTIIYDDNRDVFTAYNKSIKELKNIIKNYDDSKKGAIMAHYDSKALIDVEHIKPIRKYPNESPVQGIGRAVTNAHFNNWSNLHHVISNNDKNATVLIKSLEQQNRIVLEHDFENTIEKLLDIIINSYDSSIQDHYKDLIQTYKSNKEFPLSFKLTSLYRIIYRLMSVQPDSGLRDFIKKLRDIYMQGDLIELSDEELKELYDNSIYYLNMFDDNNND